MPSSVYAKYFFDLRTLAEANDLAYPAEPLSKVVVKLRAAAEIVTMVCFRTELSSWRRCQKHMRIN